MFSIRSKLLLRTSDRPCWPAALIVALGLAGCASSEGFLTPVPSAADAPGTSHVEMVVATTRTRDPSPAFLFAGGRAPEASFADMVVSIPPDARRQIGEVEWPRQPPGNPEADFVTLKSEIITRDQAKATLSRLLGQSREKEAFVFVHGFNNRYEDAVYRFAQILHDFGADADVAPILFTGRRPAMSSPTITTATAPIIRATISKSCCAICRTTRKSKPSRSWPIRWAIG